VDLGGDCVECEKGALEEGGESLENTGIGKGGEGGFWERKV